MNDMWFSAVFHGVGGAAGDAPLSDQGCVREDGLVTGLSPLPGVGGRGVPFHS